MRYTHAEQLETTNGIWSSWGTYDMIHIKLSGNNVDKTSEIVALVHYLRENLVYKQGAYHMDPRGDTSVRDDKSWHVTTQDHGHGAMLVRRCRFNRNDRRTC